MIQHLSMKPKWSAKELDKLQPAKIFPYPEDFAEAAEEYLEYCSKEDKVPSIAGFSMHCGTSTVTIGKYKNREGYEKLYEQFKNILYTNFQDRTLLGDYNLGMTKILLKHNYGIAYEDAQEKQDNDINITINGIDITKKD